MREEGGMDLWVVILFRIWDGMALIDGRKEGRKGEEQ